MALNDPVYEPELNHSTPARASLKRPATTPAMAISPHKRAATALTALDTFVPGTFTVDGRGKSREQFVSDLRGEPYNFSRKRVGELLESAHIKSVQKMILCRFEVSGATFRGVSNIVAGFKDYRHAHRQPQPPQPQQPPQPLQPPSAPSLDPQPGDRQGLVDAVDKGFDVMRALCRVFKECNVPFESQLVRRVPCIELIHSRCSSPTCL